MMAKKLSTPTGRYLVVLAGLLGLGSLQTPAFAADPIYAVVGQGILYKADLTTGIGSLLGTEPTYIAIAFRPGTSQLYGLVSTDGNTTFQVAQLFPETSSYTAVGPTIVAYDDLGGQVPNEMAFAPDGTVYITEPLGRILKIDLSGGTITHIRGILFGTCDTASTIFSCPLGLAWLNGTLIQTAIASGPLPADGMTTIQYLSVDPANGATVVLTTDSLPARAYKASVRALDTEGGKLYSALDDTNGGIFWGVIDPYAGTFTNLADSQLHGGGNSTVYARGLAVIPTHFAISGQVTLGGSAFSGVTMTLGGSQTGSTTTDVSGNYSFPNLPVGGNYTITPASTGYDFTLPNATFNNLSSDQTAYFAGTLIAVPSDTIGPITSGVSITPNPLAVNTGSALAATVDDSTTGSSNVAAASYSINGGASSQMLLTPSAAVTTQASASLAPFSESNVYNICVHGTDSAGNTGADSCVLLPVYDPNGSFVTGGGQVASPSGADLLNPSAAGQATFGFVSKYLPGRNTPSGNLEFQFKEGNLNFKSTSMDWLVVTGEPRAKFHGTGTVNGTNVCNFEVDAWASSFTGNVDAFGLKISSCNNGGDRYTLPPTKLTKGNIIIHK